MLCAQSLEGNWQPDLLFLLKQEQDGYEFCQRQIAECDRQLAQYLQQREDRSQGAPLPEEKRKGRLKKKRGNNPRFESAPHSPSLEGPETQPAYADCVHLREWP